MVSAMLKDAREAGLDSSASAVLFSNTETSPDLIASRTAAFRQALEAAGVPLAPDLHSTATESAFDAIRKVMDEPEPFAMVFALDDRSLGGAVQFRASMDEEAQKTLLIAGLTSERKTLDSLRYGLLNVGADTNELSAPREAIRLAIAHMRGEPIERNVVIPVSIRYADGPPRGGQFPFARERMEGPGGVDTDPPLD